MPFRLLVETHYDDSADILTYWSDAESLADAVATALAHAAALDGGAPYLTAVTAAEGESPGGFVETGTPGLVHAPTIHTWDVDANEPGLVFPRGIVPSWDDPETGGASPVDADDIREGFGRGEHEGMWWLDLVVDGRRLEQTFGQLFERLPSADGVEVRIMHHWEDTGVTEVYVAPEDVRGNGIVELLHEHNRDLFENGGVDIGIHSRAERCTFRLTDHKTLLFQAHHPGHVDVFEGAVRDLGFQPLDPFLRIASRCWHWHYAPAGLRRAGLVSTLEAAGFAKVDELEESI